MSLLNRAQEIFGKKVFKEKVTHEKGAWGIFDWVIDNVADASSVGEGYITFENGVLIQVGKVMSPTLVISNNNIGTYGWSFYMENVAIEFPKLFCSVPFVTVGTNGGFGWVNGVTERGFNYYFAFYSNSVRRGDWIAIGKWK